MKISEVKKHLAQLERISFLLPNGELVPSHFHVTEVGKISKHFIDCGGIVRTEEAANFQLFSANDYNHRLHPEKLLDIIELSQKVLLLGDLEIEVEYQGETIGKFGLHFNGTHFLLTTTQTTCLAKDNCGIPTEELEPAQAGASCAPGSGCC